jgi:hypothetical protein
MLYMKLIYRLVISITTPDKIIVIDAWIIIIIVLFLKFLINHLWVDEEKKQYKKKPPINKSPNNEIKKDKK